MMEIGTEDTIGGGALRGHGNRASATTAACNPTEPIVAMPGRRMAQPSLSTGAEIAPVGTVSVTRLILLKPEADSRAMTRATAS